MKTELPSGPYITCLLNSAKQCRADCDPDNQTIALNLRKNLVQNWPLVKGWQTQTEANIQETLRSIDPATLIISGIITEDVIKKCVLPEGEKLISFNPDRKRN
jgi:hypothetical protein